MSDDRTRGRTAPDGPISPAADDFCRRLRRAPHPPDIVGDGPSEIIGLLAMMDYWPDEDEVPGDAPR